MDQSDRLFTISIHKSKTFFAGPLGSCAIEAPPALSGWTALIGGRAKLEPHDRSVCFDQLVVTIIQVPDSGYLGCWGFPIRALEHLDQMQV